MRFVAAGRFWQWALSKLGCAAIAMPWRTVYLLPKCYEHQQLRIHEAVHIEQMDRDGTIWFCIKYLWWLYRFGYWDHPYEQEAYRRSWEILP